jgi:hypothetical protein
MSVMAAMIICSVSIVALSSASRPDFRDRPSVGSLSSQAVRVAALRAKPVSMTKTKAKGSLDANRRQGASTSERETGAGWGSPSDSAAEVPLDQHHTRRSYMGYGVLPQDTRRQLAMPGHELERLVTNVSPAQLIHGATRGMPGKRDYPDGGRVPYYSDGRPSGRIKAIHRFGLGPLVHRAADEGHDPGADPVNTGYRHNTAGPRPGVLEKYMDVARHVPEPTGYGSGYPRWHELSNHAVMGDELGGLF